MTVAELVEKLLKGPLTYEVRVGLGFPVREVTVSHETQQLTLW